MRLIYLCWLCLMLCWSLPVLATERQTVVEAPVITLVGTIQKIEVSGGCYQLLTPDGIKYELVGKFPRQNGMKVRVKGTLPQDLMTICQVGQPLRVNSIEKITHFPQP